MNTPNWDARSARDWVVQKCWDDHKRYPLGIGLFIQSKDLGPQDPPFELICEAVEYLRGKGWVSVEYNGVFRQKTPPFINKLKLTPQAIARIQDQLEQNPRSPIGFCPEG